MLLIYVLGVEAQHDAEQITHTISQVSHHNLNLTSRRLHGGCHRRLGGGLHGVWVESHGGACDACLLLYEAVEVAQSAERLTSHEWDCEVLHSACLTHPHDSADLVVQHIVNVHLALNDSQAWVVGHRHVIENPAQNRRCGVLVVNDDLGQRAPVKRVRLWVDFKLGKWDFVARLVVQHLVCRATERDLVQDRHARAVCVDPHVGFGDGDVLHCRVLSVLVRQVRIVASALEDFRFGHV